MKITDLLKKDTIIMELKSSTKEDVIDELINKLDNAGRLNNKKEFKKAILKREEEYSTGVGDGVAIPHAKTSAVKTPALAFGYSRNGIDYDALDEKPAHIFFMIAGSENANNEHLETLSRLSVMLMNEDFRKKIIHAKREEEILKIIEDQEKSDKKDEEITNNDDRGLVLAVTSCPTGIAHTYMAADALKNKAKEMDIDIKVETNGATGVKNILTDEEIRKAKAIIVAADKQVDMGRFEGKKVIQVPVAQGIKNAEELITKGLKGEGTIYHHTESIGSSKVTGKERSGFYKHIMNGVSNMLPFVVGGGILIAISFFFGIKAFDPNDPSFHPYAKLLMDIGAGNAFFLMIPILAGFIGMSIADRPGFAPAMVGGLIAANNGAGFLGGLIAGFLGGYIVLFLKKAFAKLPDSLEGIKPVLLYPLFGIFITGIIMLLVVVNPVKGLNLGLQNWLNSMGTANKVLLGLILGGMMAVDMGGPINKAAFTFGIAMIDAGNFAPHAAVMAGGMVPPLGIAIATTLFKNRFTKGEREAGKTCYIMGASFITEGAIPFAAADPGRVIPSIIVGSAVAGAFSMIFNIGLPAPHGGAFVIPIVKGNPFSYIAAILIGSFITALMLGVLKKPVNKE
ncbi:PTS fructose transporter subunit IIABC [Marinisporobacter balticus]|uniref:PTS system D-fructose-specific IIA component (F1P-forming) (Frc family) /PTS system D-fructose-specific IIB component (F1P-forming) (Frc family) /PTS system D-fructose-specific IIC component (F1P-f... n=1 Tax=Marinisporobacter balticus TaxID=2018667 RepID=A0A4R2KEC9_9FIRM|nr:PTS fructose transporter subunit IIABC [Marinisporobacter balticus]TCO68268.1 PTS system D-fructose-specific IIA component (F1P-forming) (Frc family) /PTS system D-fructose-specific IIB component (F1P-forming) (Frc family) /PTS system D-fructose-specific IIC component (F1P-forming) (Frc family) [Marinisporobacter balticus]